jgi:predicted SAM-dependent methyltransferase
MKIDLGCGSSCRPGYVGVDRLALSGVKVVHDLDVLPYPFDNNSVEEIWIDNVLEHLKNPLQVMEEVHRITKAGAKITVAVPYFRSFYATIDPTHRNFFGVHWFSYFNPKHDFFKKYKYTHCQFDIENIEFDREQKNIPLTWILYRLVRWLARRSPGGYEARLSHLYPLNSLTFHLRTIK